MRLFEQCSIIRLDIHDRKENCGADLLRGGSMSQSQDVSVAFNDHYQGKQIKSVL